MTEENTPETEEELGFDHGSVLRWFAYGKYQFAAIYCSNGFWYITGGNNTYGTSMKTSQDLLDLLEDPANKISDIEVSTGWEAV